MLCWLTYVEKGLPLPDPVTDLEYRGDEVDIYVPAQVTAKKRNEAGDRRMSPIKSNAGSSNCWPLPPRRKRGFAV